MISVLLILGYCFAVPLLNESCVGVSLRPMVFGRIGLLYSNGLALRGSGEVAAKGNSGTCRGELASDSVQNSGEIARLAATFAAGDAEVTGVVIDLNGSVFTGELVMSGGDRSTSEYLDASSAWGDFRVRLRGPKNLLSPFSDSAILGSAIVKVNASPAITENKTNSVVSASNVGVPYGFEVTPMARVRCAAPVTGNGVGNFRPCFTPFETPENPATSVTHRLRNTVKIGLDNARLRRVAVNLAVACHASVMYRISGSLASEFGGGK